MPSTDVDDGHVVPSLPDAALLEAEVRAKRPQSREQMAFVVTIIPAPAGLGPGRGQPPRRHRPIAAHVHHLQDIVAGLLIAAAAAAVTRRCDTGLQELTTAASRQTVQLAALHPTPPG